MDPIVIGIDLGGTNVRVGAVTPSGELLASDKAPIKARRGPQYGLTRIIELVEQVRASTGERPLLGIGVGSTGPIDRERGMVKNPYTLPTWENVSILEPLREHFGVPAVLENDADVAALGEAWLGAGRGVDRLAAVTVGTGIGTAFIYRGQIYRGFGDHHGEGGHMLLDPNGPECYCGGRGCWEMLAAGPAIGRLAREASAREPGLMLELAGGDLQKLAAHHVVAAARQGDPVALKVADQVGMYLAWGMVNLVALLMPECVVLSGGVMESFDLFEPEFRRVFYRHNVMSPVEQIHIAHAQLGSQAGILGAARAILNSIGENNVEPIPLRR
ncbi:MAG: glucokinase [Anaerolinea sp.]|nr:glucokinase [Anaerolinea sp.]